MGRWTARRTSPRPWSSTRLGGSRTTRGGVGRRELLRLRDDFRAARGGAFTLRGFHDAVLVYGGLPVTLMRWGLGLGE